MHLNRCKDQESVTLEEFYTELSEHDGYREGSKAMLELISSLRALPDTWRVWGLTSHHRLCLLAEDCYESPWFLIISALDSRNYFVEYRMPDHVAPWPHAYVRGEAHSENEALRMIVTAMEKSEGWGERR